MKRMHVVCLAMLVMAGCVKAKAIELAPSQQMAFEPLEDWRDVEVYDTEADVPMEYVKIAQLQSRGQYTAGGVPKHARKMQKKAAQFGANAIIVNPEFKDPSTGAKVAHALFFTRADRKGQGLAIRILRDPDERERARALGVAVYRSGEISGAGREEGARDKPE